MSSISVGDEMLASANALDLVPTKPGGNLPALEDDLLVENCTPEVLEARLYLTGMTHFFSDRA